MVNQYTVNQYTVKQYMVNLDDLGDFKPYIHVHWRILGDLGPTFVYAGFRSFLVNFCT
jgi:hypothetical protein